MDRCNAKRQIPGTAGRPSHGAAVRAITESLARAAEALASAPGSGEDRWMASRGWLVGMVAFACAGTDEAGESAGPSTSDASEHTTVGPSDETSASAATTSSSSTGTSSEASDETGVVSTGSEPDAAFTIVKTGTTYVATSTAEPSLAVEIDCDDETTDDRYFGISPAIDGQRLEIPMYGGPVFPLLVPDFDAGTIACIRVETDDTRLLVRLEAGSYQMLDPAASDTPVPLEVAFTVEDGRLVARATGIYYMMLTRADTTLTITHGAVDMRTIDAETVAFTENYDGVTSIAAADSIYGPIAIAGDIARLQVQLYDDGSEGFELDLDHAFKDLGQTSVALTLVFR